jgi:hypothetical protein
LEIGKLKLENRNWKVESGEGRPEKEKRIRENEEQRMGEEGPGK